MGDGLWIPSFALLLLAVCIERWWTTTITMFPSHPPPPSRKSGHTVSEHQLQGRSCDAQLLTAVPRQAQHLPSTSGGTMGTSACPATQLQRQLLRPLAAVPGAASAFVVETPSVSAEASAIAEYIVTGPLLGSCGLSAESVHANAAEWLRLGQRMAVQLGFDHDNLDAVQK